MSSVKFIALLIIASVYVSSIHADDEILDTIKDSVDDARAKAEKGIKDATSEAKEEEGIFSKIGQKLGSVYEATVEKGKEAYQATADAVSSSYDKLKEKAKEFIESKTEKPSS